MQPPLTGNLLIVDASRLQAVVLQRLLEDLGCRVFLAQNLELAEAQLHAQPIDLLLVDSALLADSACCDALRDQPRPWVALGSENELRALKSQVNSPNPDGFITRPYDAQQLLETLAPLLNKSGDQVAALVEENQRLRTQIEQLTTALAEDRSSLETQRGFMISLNHEVRTPLNALIGLTYLLRDKLCDTESSSLLSQLEEHGLKLLEAFDHGLKPAKRTAPNAATLCERVAQRFRLIWPDTVLELDLEPVHEALTGPMRALQEALFNLLDYAAEQSCGRPVRLSCRSRHLDGAAQPGIQFNVDYQADADLTQDDTRLQLASAVAQSVGGRTEFERTEQGARLSLVVKVRSLSLNTTKPVVFVVDDESINRRITSQFIEKLGLSVQCFSSGVELLKALSDSGLRCNLMLIDLVMPELDGMETTRRIRALSGWESVPIIAMSANAGEDIRSACKAAGMNDFVPKSSDPQPLYECLSRWLPTERASLENTHQDNGAEQALMVGLAELETALPMLDSQSAARLGVDSVAALTPLLTEFMNRYSSVSEPLELYLGCHDFPGAKRLVHSVKGAALTLGLNSIADQAGRVESLLLTPASAEFTEALEQLESQIARFSEACARWLAQSKPATESDPVDFDQMLTRLEHLLEQDNPLARDYFESKGAALKPSAPDLFKALDEMTANYDLHQARRLIEQYRTETQSGVRE